jgi:hypothetical protein
MAGANVRVADQATIEQIERFRIVNLQRVSGNPVLVSIAPPFTVRRKKRNTDILSPTRRAKNPSQSFVSNQEGLFASLRMTSRYFSRNLFSRAHAQIFNVGLKADTTKPFLSLVHPQHPAIGENDLPRIPTGKPNRRSILRWGEGNRNLVAWLD